MIKVEGLSGPKSEGEEFVEGLKNSSTPVRPGWGERGWGGL